MASQRVRRALVGGVVVGLVGLASPTAAIASDPNDGLWYYTAYHVQPAHDAGFTGRGVTIAVIDSQINVAVPTLQGANIEVHESECFDLSGKPIPTVSTDIAAVHGTNVVSLIVGSGAGYAGLPGVKGVAPDAKILYFTHGAAAGADTTCEKDPNNTSSSYVFSPLADAIYGAIDGGADIISMSIGGSADTLADAALAEALHKGIVVLAAVGNDNDDMLKALFPRADNGVVGVQSMGANSVIQGDLGTNNRLPDSDADVVGPGVDILFQGTSDWNQVTLESGTSLATPVVAGFLALVKSKYPKATGNQLIQTLIRNTGGSDHPLSYDANGMFGYGTASATHMLEVDPTQYDDVNPLINDQQSPTKAEIANPEPRPSASSLAPSPTQSASGTLPGGTLTVILVAAAIAVLIVIIAIVIVVIAVRRSRARSGLSASQRQKNI